MEKNTVCLALSEYTRLKEFEEKLSKGNTLVARNIIDPWGTQWNTSYITSDAAVKEIIGINADLIGKMNKLRIENNALKYPGLRETTLEDVKKMSIREFLKWRNK